MEREFQGFELDTPLGGLSAGRGYSRSAGEEYFYGLAIRLPMGRLRLGRLMWEESTEPQNRKPQALHQLIRHVITALLVVLAVHLIDGLLPGLRYVWWITGIWAVVVFLHFIQVLVDHVLKTESGATEAQNRQDDDP